MSLTPSEEVIKLRAEIERQAVELERLKTDTPELDDLRAQLRSKEADRVRVVEALLAVLDWFDCKRCDVARHGIALDHAVSGSGRRADPIITHSRRALIACSVAVDGLTPPDKALGAPDAK